MSRHTAAGHVFEGICKEMTAQTEGQSEEHFSVLDGSFARA